MNLLRGHVFYTIIFYLLMICDTEEYAYTFVIGAWEADDISILLEELGHESVAITERMIAIINGDLESVYRLELDSRLRVV